MKEEILEKLKSDYPALETCSEEEILAKYFEILGHPEPKPTAKKYKTYVACLEKLINECRICVECYYELARGVCETCRNRKRNAVSDDIKQLRISENDEIIQTTALKEFFLDKEDLQEIDCNRVKSSGKSYYIHLYQQDDVIKVALNKYGGLEGFLNEKRRRENKKNIREERKEKRESDRMNELREIEKKYNISMSDYYVDYCSGKLSKNQIASIIANLVEKKRRREEISNYSDFTNEEREKYENSTMTLENFRNGLIGQKNRRTALVKKLEEKGLQLRGDSKLCKQYIKRGEGDLQYIVDVMEEMDWFYKNTKYAKFYKEAKDREYEDWRSYRGWGESFEYDPTEISEIAKKMAISDYLGGSALPPLPPHAMQSNKEEKEYLVLPLNVMKYIKRWSKKGSPVVQPCSEE
jgi:hypothetical protein